VNSDHTLLRATKGLPDEERGEKMRAKYSKY